MLIDAGELMEGTGSGRRSKAMNRPHLLMLDILAVEVRSRVDAQLVSRRRYQWHARPLRSASPPLLTGL